MASAVAAVAPRWRAGFSAARLPTAAARERGPSWRHARPGRSPTRSRERAELEGLAPRAALARPLAGGAHGARLDRSGDGPGADRRPRPPARGSLRRRLRRLAAGRRVPRREGRADPFLSESQRGELGLPPRRDDEAEERYLFHASLALPRRRLFLSYRDSDENGAAEARSPFLDDVGRLLELQPPPPARTTRSQAELTRGRDLAQVVHRLSDAPSERELARSIAARGQAVDAGALLTRSRGSGEERGADRQLAREGRARRSWRRARPGPLRNPAVLERLASVGAYGGTTLEGFDLCSYRWFVSHELRPERLDPAPDPLVQGGIMHAALERLYREAPGGDPLPRPGSLAAWTHRGRELVAEIAAERGLAEHPVERAILRRVEGLLARFLTEEAERERPASAPGCWRPGSVRPTSPSGRCWRSTAGRCTARSTGSTATPTGAPW